jgi:uncharacterized protein YaiE (UPF0345 family)
MKCISKIAGIALLSATMSSHAGFWANTAHSRANCKGFNESITWNWNEYHWWEVKSIHFKQSGNGPDTHEVMSWMAYTWRAAAYDFWRDPAGPMANQYHVQGYHYYMAYNGSYVYDVYTDADGCNLYYDGWWDKNKANGE